ncbi:MAG TPA: Hsp20/alpha crystallin family protein [Euzebyales bacterium]
MFGQYGGRWRNGGMMPMDAFEKDGVYTLRFDLAGADPDAVDVTVEHGVLTITAEGPVEETEGVNWLVRERPTGTHSRQVRLGDRLDASNIDAQYDHGVLTVTIPIRPEAKPHKVSIRSGNESQTIEAESASS